MRRNHPDDRRGVANPVELINQTLIDMSPPALHPQPVPLTAEQWRHADAMTMCRGTQTFQERSNQALLNLKQSMAEALTQGSPGLKSDPAAIQAIEDKLTLLLTHTPYVQSVNKVRFDEETRKVHVDVSWMPLLPHVTLPRPHFTQELPHDER